MEILFNMKYTYFRRQSKWCGVGDIEQIIFQILFNI